MRSLLFIPADDERKLAKGLDTGADALLLDLEDAVSEPRKAAAREIAAGYLATTRPLATRPRLYVRINALDTPHWEKDLAGVVASGPDGILLPKARSGEDVHKLSIALTHAEQSAGLATGATRIIVLATEVPVSLLAMHTYIDASARMEGITWGAEDLSGALGAKTNRESDGRTWRSPYRLARDLCLVTAMAANVQPLDTVFVNFRDEEGLRLEAEDAARDGFTGKMAIHPGQVAAINEVFTPTAEAVTRAEAVIAAFAASPGAGTVGIGGVMYDRPHLERARQLLARAKAVAK